MKKFLFGFCAVLMIISLSACSKTDKGDASSSAADANTTQAVVEETNAPSAETEAAEEKKEVKVNKTFVSKSKEKNSYQQSKTEHSVQYCKSASSLKSWKKDGIKKQIVKFVDKAIDKNSNGYIPPEDRIVVSDIDGTLIAEEGKKIDNDKMVMKTPAQVKDYLLRNQHNYFDSKKKLAYSGILYQPMAEMFDYLAANGFDIYFVSGNCNSLTYAWANYYFNADYSHSIGSNVELEIDETDGFKMGPTGQYEGCWNEMKSYRIYNQIGKCPVLAFGNSDGDVKMLQWITTNPDYPSMSIMINHDDKREYVYSVETISYLCQTFGFVDAKMSENFKTVFAK